MSTKSVKKIEEKNQSLKRKKELEAEIKRLQTFLPKLDLAIDDNHRKFLLEKENAKFRNRGGPDKLQISMVKSSDTIEGKISQLQTELGRVNTHLGTRYLKRGSRVPRGINDKGWSFKAEPGTNHMVNPDYIADFDPEIQAKKKAILDKQDKNIPLTPAEVKQNEVLNQNGSGGKLKINSIDKALESTGSKNLNIETVGDPVVETKIKNKQRAPADLAWVNIDERVRGHTLRGPNFQGSVGGKNSVANNKARLLLDRARAINRAYGGMSDSAKTNYLNNPRTQLEVENWG